MGEQVTCVTSPGKYTATTSWSPVEIPKPTIDALFSETSATLAPLRIDAETSKARSFEAASLALGKITHSAKWTIGGSTPNFGGTLVALKFATGMTYTIEGVPEIAFASNYTTSVQTITTAKLTLPTVVFEGKAKYKLEDELKCTALVIQEVGELKTNGQTIVTAGVFTFTVGTLSLGSSTLAISGEWNVTGAGTLNAETSTIQIPLTGTTFAGGGKTYNVVNLENDAIKVTGANTFSTLNLNNKAGATGIKLAQGVTQTVTTLATNGTEANPTKLISSESEKPATIKLTGTQTVSFLKAKDIHVTSGALKVKIPSGTKAEYDLGGNEGITFEEQSAISSGLSMII